jgi:hypothetical protein
LEASLVLSTAGSWRRRDSNSRGIFTPGAASHLSVSRQTCPGRRRLDVVTVYVMAFEADFTHADDDVTVTNPPTKSRACKSLNGPRVASGERQPS